MKVMVRFYRMAKVPTEHLKAAAGLDDSAPADLTQAKLTEMYGPMAMGLKFFWDSSRHAHVGLEVMAFDIQDAQIPTVGLVTHDPLIPEEIHRVDGALHGELARIGVFTRPETYKLAGVYELKGN